MTGTVTVTIRPRTAQYQVALRHLRRKIRNSAHRYYPVERRVESARRRRIDRQMAVRDRRAVRAERRAS